jgi:hypothetical protein
MITLSLVVVLLVAHFVDVTLFVTASWWLG